MDKVQIDRILKVMKEKGISKKGLARSCSVSHPTIIRLLRDTDYNPTLETLKKIALNIGIEVNEILEGKDFKKSDFLGVNGFIDYRGEVRRIKNYQDLKTIVAEIDKDLNAPKEAQAIIDEDIANQKTQFKESINISSIDLFKPEEYDTSKVNTWSFRKSDDEKEKFPNSLGNMCKGYPFKVCGENFQNSECAYICGLFSQSSDKSIEIQRELQQSDNGYEAKKAIRRKYEQMGLGRADWNTFNVQWMLFVVWQKVMQNEDFQKLLRNIPNNAIIVENSTYQKGETSNFWGAKNPILKEKLEVMERAAEVLNYKEKKSELKRTKMLTRNSINHVGLWKGFNCMGKILTICKHCIEQGIEPNIDYDLLRSKQIYLFGKLLTFDDVPHKAFIKPMSGLNHEDEEEITSKRKKTRKVRKVAVIHS